MLPSVDLAQSAPTLQWTFQVKSDQKGSHNAPKERPMRNATELGISDDDDAKYNQMFVLISEVWSFDLAQCLSSLPRNIGTIQPGAWCTRHFIIDSNGNRTANKKCI
jgi:hypothetical protein